MYCLYRKNQNDPVITLMAVTGTRKAAEEIRNNMSAKQPECKFAILRSPFCIPHLRIDLRELVNPHLNLTEVEKTFCFH